MQGIDMLFFISGCSESDMGQLAEILPEHTRVFAPRWDKKSVKVDFSPEKHDGLIILGDGEYWATSHRYQRERDWLAKAIKSGTPVLGVCHGAQLMAAYLDNLTENKALSERRTSEHYGTLTEIAVEEEWTTDPVVRHFAEGAFVTQYHEDAFQLPRGAVALCWSKDHPYRHCEAFRVGSAEAAVYGLQFHPEPTLLMLQSEGEKEHWFKPLPPLAKLQRAVQAGEQALRAWVDLATARRIKRGQEAN